MFFQLLIFEWRYHIKHISSLIFAIFFFGMGYLLVHNGFVEPNLYKNATYNIAKITGLLSLVSILGMMILASRVTLRDRQHKMHELVYATPISKFLFISTRFIGLYSFSLFLFSFAILGLWMGALLSSSGNIGPITFLNYIWPYVVFAIPNLLIGSVVLFVIACLTQNTLFTYVGGIFLYCLYWVCAIFLNSPLIVSSTPASEFGMALAAILDPFGLSAFLEQTQYWEVWERNTELIRLEGFMLYNRLLWMGISAAILIINYKVFHFRKGATGVKNKDILKLSNRRTHIFSPISFVKPQYNRSLLQLWSNVKVEFHQLLSSWPFLLLMIIWIGIVASEMITRIYGGGEYGTNLYPTTYLMIWLYEDPFPFMSLLLVIFYAGEIIHNERQLNIYGIKDCLPVGNKLFFWSKYAVVASIPVLMIGSAIVVGVICQISKGWFQFEPVQYLSSFYFLGFPVVLFALLTIFIQTLVPNKYVGMLVSIIFLMMQSRGISEVIGFTHPLLQVGVFPTVAFNEMNGWSQEYIAFNWLALYWGSLYVFIGVLVVKFWKRGVQLPMMEKIRQLFNDGIGRFLRIGKQDLLGYMSLGVIIAVLFLFLHHNIYVLNTYETASERLDRQADYEKKYKQFQDLPELSIVDVKADVFLYPSKRKYEIKQRFELENKTQQPIDRVWFSTIGLDRLQKFKIEGAYQTDMDPVHGVYWFEFNESVSPGERRTMEYDIENHHQGFKLKTSFMENAVVENGTNVMNMFILPIFGYTNDFEVKHEEERKKRGLEPHENERATESHAGIEESDNSYYKFMFEAVVSTEKEQTAIAPGELIRQWEEDGRAYFHYKTRIPINNFYSYISGEYDVKTTTFQETSLDIYYQNGHDFNIDRMMESMVATLDYCENAFAPYALSHLRLAEIPGSWPMGGYASHGNIGLVENRAFFTDLRDSTSFDVVSKRVVHEVAHQWFGHQLTPRGSEGGTMIVESLAKYMECVMLDRLHGKQQLRMLLKDQMHEYFSQRNRLSKVEPPLSKVENEGFIFYAKGAIVMHALKELLGENTFNAAIREMFNRYAYPNPMGEAQDFVDILKDVSAEHHHQMIDEYLSEVVVYDLQVEAVSYEELPNGKYKVKADIHAEKSRLDEGGKLNTVPLETNVTIALLKEHPDHLNQLKETIYYQKHLLITGKNTLTFVLDEFPNYISVDPFLNLPDKNLYDNIMKVER